ncbi:Hypp5822 [Branchiostoma lanceolatum]|uniref:NAD(+) hydrolase SARM1 n=1 Tax=Branchiostoma lanceolatum TaxID=7740 RepID=A0A8J9YME8_BRALA|nr:Hypp5822 [Branchiostoma lanceolatum]
MALTEDESSTLTKELAPVVHRMTEAIAAIKSSTGDVSAVRDRAASLKTEVREPYKTYATKSQRLYLGDHLADIGAAQVFTGNIQWLRGTDHGGFSEDVGSYLTRLYACCQYYTDSSDKFAKELGKSGIIPVLAHDLKDFKETWPTDQPQSSPWQLGCQLLLDRTLSNSTEGGVVGLTDYYPTGLNRKDLEAAILAPSIRQLFNANNAIESLIPYLKADNEQFRTVATLTLAYVIDEENLGILADPSVIRLIIKVFTKAVDDKNASAFKLAMGIERLAVNDTQQDNNKKILVAEGVLPPLFKLMSEGDEEEQLHAIRAVSQLAFHPSNRERIRRHVPQLRQFKSSGNPDIAAAASGALWQLHEMEARKQKVKKPDDGITDDTKKDSRAGHVMLSYKWDNQEVVKQIKTKLEANGYNVWMDIDRMGGSTLEAMAGAVENAAVVLICMSRKYKESANCRREAFYTADTKKVIIPLMMESGYKADGWLGLLVASLLYFNFSGKESFESVMARLMKEIGDRGKEAVTDVEVDAAASQLEGLKLHNWTKEDVKSWIQENQLEGDLDNLEPEDLLFLQKIEKKAPIEFYNSIRDELGLTSISMKRKFCDALEKLK